MIISERESQDKETKTEDVGASNKDQKQENQKDRKG